MEARRIREEQDAEYAESLKIDEAKDEAKDKDRKDRETREEVHIRKKCENTVPSARAFILHVYSGESMG